jgi:hypothetical protein
LQVIYRIKSIKNSKTKNRMDNMKKISSILLALFIALTFSNTAIAGHSEEAGGFWDTSPSNMYRCNITYVKRYADHSTKQKYLTTQHRVRGDVCDWGARHLADKIIKWLNKDDTNQIIAFSDGLACKKRTHFKWGEYGKCDILYPTYKMQMIKILDKRNSAQNFISLAI